ncbi:MAG: hypothetical protein U0822_09940 [Anaerolineae bacterium]
MANRFLIVCGGSGTKLLGQRRILGVDAELHIDVSSEIKERTEDPRSLVLQVDTAFGNVLRLLDDVEQRVGAGRQAGHSDYVQTAITDPADVRHARCLIDRWPSGASIRDGLAQAPAIGGAAIRHADNVRLLRAKLSQMINQFAQNVGPQNPIDAWIISSTAGGTGEGLHRFVAATLADLVDTNYRTDLKINFIRVGALTYKSVGPRRTACNTFFGVAADTALEMKFGQDFRGVAVSWYYVDLPDVGSQNHAKQVRGNIIEMAVKAIMLPELSQDLDRLLINNQGLRQVIVRTGYWGHDFDDQVKYYEVLTEIGKKLRTLTEPDPVRFLENRSAPEYDESLELQRVLQNLGDQKYVLDRVRSKGWDFPRYAERGRPDDPKLRELVADWEKAIDALIEPGTLDALDIGYTTVEPVMPDSQASPEVPLRAPAVRAENRYDKTWADAVIAGHRTRAWIAKLLDGPDGLKEALISKAQECSRAWHAINPFASKAQKVTALCAHLPKFASLLKRVSYLLELDDATLRFLDRELAGPRDLEKFVAQQREYAKSRLSGSVASSPVAAAELWQSLDRLTNEPWLAALDRAAQQRDTRVFKQEVLRGATGLTEAGLRAVLQVSETADITTIRKALRERMGRMYSADKSEFEAQWWQASEPPGVTMEFRYRILPHLDGSLMEQLQGGMDGDTSLSYIATGLGVIGLYVLAFHGVSLNSLPAPDTITSPVYLLRPLVPIVRDTLEAWTPSGADATNDGRFDIACAGVIGEPLYVDALRKAGLRETEIQQIGEFYTFYSGRPAGTGGPERSVASVRDGSSNGVPPFSPEGTPDRESLENLER